ncbi:hypothetical protein [Amycolatopsis echigonensis]|nr:hypothetical protein [Amycolatopsis niigatensis]
MSRARIVLAAADGHSAKDFVKDTVTGRPPQSAGQVFDRVVKGR